LLTHPDQFALYLLAWAKQLSYAIAKNQQSGGGSKRAFPMSDHYNGFAAIAQIVDRCDQGQFSCLIKV